jgi:hypothetical protein
MVMRSKAAESLKEATRQDVMKLEPGQRVALAWKLFAEDLERYAAFHRLPLEEARRRLSYESRVRGRRPSCANRD